MILNMSIIFTQDISAFRLVKILILPVLIHHQKRTRQLMPGALKTLNIIISYRQAQKSLHSFFMMKKIK